jgi:hypothetical protein
MFKSPKAFRNKQSSADVKKSTSDVIPATSPPAVLQLNVIDGDGSMTSVIYPGKLVALELHTSHDSQFVFCCFR